MAKRHKWALNRTRTECVTTGADYGTWDIYPCQNAGCAAEHGIRREMALDVKRYRADATAPWSRKRPPCGAQPPETT